MSGLTQRNGNPSNESDAKNNRSRVAEIMSRRRRIAFHLYAYNMRMFITRTLRRLLPFGRRRTGIRWAPLKIPISRRLETLAMSMGIFTEAIMPVFSYVLLYYLLYSRLWWLGLIYTFYILHDEDVASNGGRRWETYRNWALHRYMARYSPIKLVKTAELDPSRNYIAPTSPHGQFMLGANISFLSNGTQFTSTFPGIKTHVAIDPGRLRTPFLRELKLFGGAVSASVESILYLMDRKRKGNFVSVNLGGSAEVMANKQDVYNVVVINKKEYARIAIKTGASIVPVFCFGETRAFKTGLFAEGTWLRSLQDMVHNVTGIALVPIMGRGFFQYNFGIIPHRTPITVVVGEPIPVQQNCEPTQQDVNILHQKYLKELVQLFEMHKHKYEPNPNIKLVLM